MVNRVDTAYISIWDMLVGAVSWDADKEYATFEFYSKFLKNGLDLSPIKMPISEALNTTAKFEFHTLPKRAFKGLPGLLADALPDNFGNQIIDSWLSRQGRTAESFSPVERLCCTNRYAEFKDI